MYPIYALWSHPRSMSTALERIMRERGDLDCAHEPFMYDYYVHRKVREMPHFEVQADHPVAYADIRDMLLERAKQQPVFFKDMSYYVMPHMLEDEAFMAQLTHCFLIRDPVASITSYFKLDPEVSCEEIGIEAQWHHYCALRDLGQQPVVIEAEAIRRDTRGAMHTFWQQLGLPFIEQALHWQSEQPKDWGQVSGWHQAVTHSSGIAPLDEKALQAQQQAFLSLAEVHPNMQAYWAHHQPFYQQLKTAIDTAEVALREPLKNQFSNLKG